MTAIVGLVHGGRVYMGGDSAAPSGWSLTLRADSKVFRNGPYLMGFTTSFRMGQLLRYSLRPPAPSGSLDKFMATTFVDAVRECLKAGGWANKAGEREDAGTFLVGVSGRLFKVWDDYQVQESLAPYDAAGCGTDITLGAMYATPRMAPRRRILLALEAAERLNAGVRGPFTCMSTRRSV